MEEALWREAVARGVEFFYPQMRVQPKNPRARKIWPYFPGHLFIQLDLRQRVFIPSTLALVAGQAFAWMPHSLELVTFGAEPASPGGGWADPSRPPLELPSGQD